MNIKESLGLRISSLRKDKGLSQEKLALRSGLDRTYINSVENGKRNVSIVNISKIAKALKISLKRLFESGDFN